MAVVISAFLRPPFLSAAVTLSYRCDALIDLIINLPAEYIVISFLLRRPAGRHPMTRGLQ
eukprot:scaffold7512_cov133-Skeletonema_marinoi.AAC.8